MRTTSFVLAFCLAGLVWLPGGRAHAQAYDADARARLKRLSEQLVGIR